MDTWVLWNDLHLRQFLNTEFLGFFKSWIIKNNSIFFSVLTIAEILKLFYV